MGNIKYPATLLIYLDASPIHTINLNTSDL